MLKCLPLFSSVTKRDVQQVHPTEICEVSLRTPEMAENLKNHEPKSEIEFFDAGTEVIRSFLLTAN